MPSISINSIGKTRDRLNHTLIYFRDSSWDSTCTINVHTPDWQNPDNCHTVSHKTKSTNYRSELKHGNMRQTHRGICCGRSYGELKDGPWIFLYILVGFGCATRICAARNRLFRLINTQNEALRVPPRPLQLCYSFFKKFRENPSLGKNTQKVFQLFL